MKLYTYTGKTLDYERPRPESVCIEDIAVGLSQEYRFGNQGPAYTVAQHSLLCVQLAQELWVPEVRPNLLEVLLHDATEAYMHDLPTPLKRLLPGYKEIEARLWADAIAPAFGLKPYQSAACGEVDQLALEVELLHLMPEEVREREDVWATKPREIDRDLVEPFVSWTSEEAHERFLKCFHELTETNR